MVPWFLGSFFSASPASSTTSQVTTGTSSIEFDDDTKRHETIERLCDRLQSAIRIEDRRETLRFLKQVSKKWKLDVATQTMTQLADIIRGDRSDVESIQLALEILLNIMTFDPANNQEQKNLPADISVQFTELFNKEKENIHATLDLIEENDFNLRRVAIQLLTVLLKNCTKPMQDRILESGPMAVAKLVDLLQDQREVIRNEALLLLNVLTQFNGNIQKIVAFENGFERLFEILNNEDGCQGGIVVEDCLNVLLKLLKNNSSNQSFFRESSYIRRLVDFFQLNSLGDDRWFTQKNTNVELLLQVVRTLVSPNNSNQNLLACQRAVRQCGLLHRLCAMLTLTNIPATILAETINTIGDVIRGYNDNQQFFGSVMNTNNDDQQSILISLMYTMVAREKQLLTLRLAILYCFECYLHKNDYGRSQVLQTLLPQTETVGNQYTLGHLLLVGYLSKDVVASWCSGIALTHLIADHQQFKEMLLQVILQATEEQTGSKSLMEISVNLLENSSSSIQTRIATLILICTWLAHCPLAVQTFLSMPNSISYLISQISLASSYDERDIFISSMSAFALGLCLIFNNNQIVSSSSESLERIIQKRIGLDVFQERLESLSKLDAYSKTLKNPQLQISHVHEMLLDYEFLRLYKILEGSIMKALNAPKQEQETMSSDVRSSALLAQYYHYIELQNQRISFYEDQERQFLEERQSYQMRIFQLETTLHSLKSTTNTNSFVSGRSIDSQTTCEKSIQTESWINCENQNETDEWQKQINQLQLTNRILEEKLIHEQRKVSVLQSLEGQIEEMIDEKTRLNEDYQRLHTAYERRTHENNDLSQLCSAYDEQLKQARTFIQTTGMTIPSFSVQNHNAAIET